MKLTLGHSPDPDDAFLTYPIVHKKIEDLKDIDIREIVADIETLNKLALVERLDITAVSVGAYMLISDKYYLIPYGASVGYNYGPKLLIREISNRDIVIAVPGRYTTARILSELFLKEEYSIENIKIIDVQFDKITELVINEVVDCGVLIHEEQLKEFNIEHVDLGEWWKRKTGLPIPLGVDVIHERVGENIAKRIARAFENAIRYSYKNMNEVLEYAMRFSRLKDRELVAKFIQMYVKDVKMTKDSEEVNAIKKLHELCREYDIEPFSRSVLNVRIIE